MNISVIKNNELNNDKKTIHLYRDSSINLWVAYGYSAYSLHLCASKNKCDNFSRFYHEGMMPCSMVSDYSLKKLKNSYKTIHQEENYIVLQTTSSFVVSDYTKWSDSMQQVKGLQGSIKVETRVSKKLPKGEYIHYSMPLVFRGTKRFLDCVLALISLLIFSPLFLFCYILIKREDGGPVIFKQERIGLSGKPFNIYKFRSMRLDAENFGPQLSHGGGESDSRLTRVGKFIRSHHFDELPQLWNVFVGDMSFIGPRPERKFYIDQILEYDDRYRYLYQIRPGVTSYATIYNGYTDSMEKMLCRLEYDLYYLRHSSWLFDMKILMITFFSIVFGKKF